MSSPAPQPAKRASPTDDGQPLAKRAPEYRQASRAWDRARALEERMFKISSAFKAAFETCFSAFPDPDMLSNCSVHKASEESAVFTVVQNTFWSVTWLPAKPHPMGWAALTVDLQCRQLSCDYAVEDTPFPDGPRITVDVDLAGTEPEFSVWDGGVPCDADENCPEVITDDLNVALAKVLRFARIRVLGEDEAGVWDEEEREDEERYQGAAE